jgi:putative CocE/NonD family hydrolase
MIGGSYLGWVQWWAARERPPHLTTIIPNVAPPDPFYNIPYDYGVFFLGAAIWWAEVLDREATADISGSKMADIAERKYVKLLRPLPVIDLDKAVLGKENPYWRKWIAHPVNDDYWEQANFLERLQDVRIPVFHQSGWFDGDGIGTKLNYLAMARHHHPNQKLVLGPWGHTDEAARRIGDRDFGPGAIIDLQRAYLRWFDFWLKGVENGVTKEPLISVFVMGSDRWLHGDTYPLPQTKFEKWYLTSGGKANTTKGDGKLSPAAPAADSPADRYTYDPADPTPRPDLYEETETTDGKVKSTEEKKKAEEAHHAAVTEARGDILVYDSGPLEKPLTFVGPLSAVLYASTSARDTDWFVRLMEVDAKGKIFPLSEGKIRARYRQTTKKVELLELGKVYEYHLDLWHTGITIPKGNRLRVEVASASFPMFSRNLNTGGHNETETQFVKAEQTIYHSKEYPSHVLLPVVELKDK